MVHLYRTLVTVRGLILAGTLILAAIGGYAAAARDHPPVQAASGAACAGSVVTTVPETYLISHWGTTATGCATAAAVSSTGFVPDTYLVQQWG